MRIWPILFLSGTLTGCSSTPIELPTCEIPEVTLEVTEPLSLPERPAFVSSTDSTATLDLDGVRALQRYRIAAETNTEIAQRNAEALEARNASVNALRECAEYLEIWIEVREDMLRQERRDHTIDNIWHRALILVGVGVSL